MPQLRAKAVMVPTTELDAVTLLTQLAVPTTGATAIQPWRSTNASGRTVLCAEYFFNTAQRRNNWITALRDQWDITHALLISAGSYVETHSCSHNDATIEPCDLAKFSLTRTVK